jgi:hypothetical protein
MIDAIPRVSVTFNTGQILIGLAAGYKHFGDESYLRSLHRAAVVPQRLAGSDGCWGVTPAVRGARRQGLRDACGVGHVRGGPRRAGAGLR